MKPRYWWWGLGALLAFIAVRGIRIATNQQIDEQGKRINVTITVIAGFGNNINLSDTRINSTDEDHA